MEVDLVPDPASPGELQAVKRAATPREVARLEREWALLVEADLAGLVEPLGPVEPAGEGAALLRTRGLPGPNLALAPPYSPDEVAGLFEVLATTLADLHDRGYVHGAVGAAHVVLDGDGRPVLCSLGRGGRIGEPASEGGADRLDPNADVADLGALVSHLVSWARTGAPPVDPWELVRADLAAHRRRKQPAPADPFEALTELADQASDPDPTRRPAARSLAAAVAQRIPTRRLPGTPAADEHERTEDPGRPPSRARLRVPLPPRSTTAPTSGPATRLQSRLGPFLSPDRDDGPDRNDEPAAPPRAAPAAPEVVGPARTPRLHPSRRTAAVLAVAGGAVLLGLVGPGVARSFRSPAPAAPLATAAPPAASAAASTTAAVPPTAASAPRSAAACPARSGPAADVDGDGCPEPIALAAGVVSAGRARFAVGGDALAVVTGDWWCRGRASLGLLRRDGSVTLFDGWPGAVGQDVAGRVVGVVADATGLGVEPRTQVTCDRPEAVVAGGPPVALDPGAGP